MSSGMVEAVRYVGVVVALIGTIVTAPSGTRVLVKVGWPRYASHVAGLHASSLGCAARSPCRRCRVAPRLASET